jgi:hypothetical protein
MDTVDVPIVAQFHLHQIGYPDHRDLNAVD